MAANDDDAEKIKKTKMEDLLNKEAREVLRGGVLDCWIASMTARHARAVGREGARARGRAWARER